MSITHKARLFVRQLLPDHCSVQAPWFDDGDPQTQDLHRLALSVLREFDKTLRRRSLFVRLVRQAGAVAWPANAAFRSIAILALVGSEVKREFGVSVFTQMGQLLWAAYRHNIAPKAYYKFRLFENTNRACVSKFIQDHEIGAISRLVRERFETQSATIDHKYAFWRFCVRHDLPVVSVLAFGDSKHEAEWFVEELPADDLVLKRTNLSAGHGFECWFFDAEQHRWSYHNTYLDESELRQRFATVMREEGAVVQPRIRNHPAIQPIAPRALSAVRVVTALDDEYTSRVVASSIRLGVGDSMVDNFSRGGIAVQVDPETGRLARLGVGEDIGSGWYRKHPDTDEAFCDKTLPMWQQIREVCLRAHDRAGGLPAVGWDVAITSNGPLLVEANTLWGSELIQGGTPLPDTLLRALHRALATPPSEFVRFR